MAPCACSKISTTDTLVLGEDIVRANLLWIFFVSLCTSPWHTSEKDPYQTIQILLGIFHVLMWYFLLILYMGQIRGVFGTYEPVTYRIGCTLWGIFFIISGAVLIKVAKHPSPRLVTLALILNITCIITVIIAVILTIVELSSFHSVSYRNYGQAKLGREVSRVLLFSYLLELAIAFTYSIFGCIDLAIQMVAGLICNWLGVIWTYLLATQEIAFGKVYAPLLAFIGYPYWASLTFLFSGLLTIMLEKNRTQIFVSYAIAVNIMSACVAVIGLLLLSFEFITSNLNSDTVIWPQRSGKMLSQYLFIFITLELIVSCMVTNWACKAKHGR